MTSTQLTRFFTIADRRFFPGAVATLNSLHLTGNIGDMIVLDLGLTPEQCESLEHHATVIRIRVKHPSQPVLAKAFPHVLGAEGTIVLIDSDMMVTGSLSSIVSLAEEGKICVFPDHYTARNRWFAEWQEIFELPVAPRHQTYFNAGFLCFSTHHWPDLLRLYWEACQVIPSARVHRGASVGGDFGTGTLSNPVSLLDQDALNALLMSVVPPEAIAEIPSETQATRGDLTRVRIIDEQSLACSLDGWPTTILHYTRSPKAWEHANWWRARWDAFTLLMPRVLLADDVPVRLQAATMPIWARPGRLSRTCLRVLDLGHRVAAPPSRKVRKVLRSRGPR